MSVEKYKELLHELRVEMNGVREFYDAVSGEAGLAVTDVMENLVDFIDRKEQKIESGD